EKFWTVQPTFGRGLALTLLVTLLLSGLLAWQWGIYEVSEEGRILERLQEVFLSLVAATLMVAALEARAAPRMLFVGMLVVTLVIFLRELGVDRDSSLGRLLRSSPVRLGQTLLFVGVGVVYVFLRPHYLSEIGKYFFSRRARYLHL